MKADVRNDGVAKTGSVDLVFVNVCAATASKLMPGTVYGGYDGFDGVDKNYDDDDDE